MILRLIDNYENLSYKERYAKATHYYDFDPKGYTSLLGVIDKFGNFVSVLINIHRNKAKKEFKYYDAFKELKK